jgi:hypothetical protein
MKLSALPLRPGELVGSFLTKSAHQIVNVKYFDDKNEAKVVLIFYESAPIEDPNGTRGFSKMDLEKEIWGHIILGFISFS